ncbi:MAG: PIN domain-containing protein [Gaiellaceae bacterium MAG52_C11]|nr:PIN domain-containing protein [Candidatus Gaiellasilicea maunaloa]
MPLYLADASIWIAQRRRRGSYLDELVSDRYENGEIVTCVPVVLEVLGGAADRESYERDWDFVFTALDWLPLDDASSRRAVAVQRELAATTRGAHRRPAIDYLIAACAELSDEIVLWHWDHDLRVICEYTGQPREGEHARARRHRLAQPD